MLAREQLSVVLATALVYAACAVARPDTSYKRSYDNPVKGDQRGINQNTVIALPEPQIHPVLQFDTVPEAALAPNNEEESVGTTPAPAASADQAAALEAFRDSTKPVNKRFPSAVLFGGTCGGTIIDRKWVITAAHCTIFTSGRYVLAGTNNTGDDSGVVRKVKNLYVHPLFSVGPYWLNARKFGIRQVPARWDFMLAELEEPFDLDGETIAAAPLDERTALPPYTYTGYAGYGTDHHGGYMRSEMHAMNLQTLPEEMCSSTLEQYNSEDMLCTRGYEPDFDSACNGDSGSGLVTPEGKLVGIASWVEDDALVCAKKKVVVFSRVASAKKWINKIMSDADAS